MTAIAYTVTASLPDKHTRDDYIAWLEDGHLDAVIKGGAHSASIIKLDRDADSDPFRVETRYIFATRARFDDYTSHHAPKLREEGVRLFIPRRVIFSRTIGEVV